MSDTALVDLARDNDQQAWREIIRRYAKVVEAVAYSYHLSHADVADAAGATWLALAENLDRIQQPDRLKAWLVTSARHESLRLTRLKNREYVTEPGFTANFNTATHSASPEEIVLGRDRMQRLTKTCTNLTGRCWKIMRLILDAPDLTYAQLARTLEVPIGTISSTRSRCIAALRRKMLLSESAFS